MFFRILMIVIAMIAFAVVGLVGFLSEQRFNIPAYLVAGMFFAMISYGAGRYMDEFDAESSEV